MTTFIGNEPYYSFLRCRGCCRIKSHDRVSRPQCFDRLLSVRCEDNSTRQKASPLSDSRRLRWCARGRLRWNFGSSPGWDACSTTEITKSASASSVTFANTLALADSRLRSWRLCWRHFTIRTNRWFTGFTHAIVPTGIWCGRSGWRTRLAYCWCYRGCTRLRRSGACGRRRSACWR